MKYDATVNPGDENTSHALVVRLVGSNKRVLDVGCATGYLAEALRTNGNRVWGVEYDAEAAKQAAPHLEEMLVGDVETLDLVGKFGRGSFDAVVFADVLEHLKDPTRVLERSRELLADGGSVVISIPNVAHGAVRLSLLKGRFDYQPLGLLDDTHLRFFTRRSLTAMIAEAGFTIAEELRTTAPPFETEIAVSPAEFPPEVVADLSEDPESETYQFVVRAVPSETSATAGSTDELRDLRASLTRIVAAFARVDDLATIGIVDARGAERDVYSDIRMAVLLSELRRRLLGFELRAWSLSDDSAPVGLGDEPAIPLLPWTKDSLDVMRAVAGEVVAIGGSRPTDSRSEEVLAEMETGGIRVLRWSLADTVPDPLILAGRIADAQALSLRRAQLVAIGALGATQPTLLVSLDGPGLPDLLEEIVGSRPALSAMTRVVLDENLSPFDTLAAVACSGFVLTDSVAVASLAAGLSRPTGFINSSARHIGERLRGLGVFSIDHDALPDCPESLPSRLDKSVIRDVDVSLDRLAEAAVANFAAALERETPHRVEAIAMRISSLETANAALRQRLVEERHAMINIASHRPTDETESQGELIRALQREHELSTEVAALKDELARVYATRTMRALQPLRRLYGLARFRR